MFDRSFLIVYCSYNNKWGWVSQIFLLKKFLTLLLGGWVRVFGVKLLNRVDIQKIFFHHPLHSHLYIYSICRSQKLKYTSLAAVHRRRAI